MDPQAELMYDEVDGAELPADPTDEVGTRVAWLRRVTRMAAAITLADRDPMPR